MLGRLKHLVMTVAAPMLGNRWKEYNELGYWRGRRAVEGELTNDHYKRYYTQHFGMDDSDYAGKRVLDIGCGPRGSLEWATMAFRRVGVDPLAKEYLKLGADRHQMEYLAAPAEKIPLESRAFDIVCSFNSLDHVENVQAVIHEIKRLTASGGVMLLLVEINHPPTSCEPHSIGPGILHEFEPEFSATRVAVYRPGNEGLYKALDDGHIVPDPMETRDVGWLSAKLLRR